MQFTLAALLSTAALATAQVTFDPNTNTFTCAKQTGAYCASGSLKSNIIIRCNAGKGQPGNCNDNLAGIPPIGVKTSALCYESSATAADAACSFNGVVYPGGNSSFPIPPAGSNGTVTSTPIGVPTATLYTSVSGAVPPPPAGTGPAGPVGTGGNGGAGSTGTGGSGPSGPSATWAPTGVPSQTPLPTSNAGSSISSNWALLPAAGFLAFLL